MKKNDILSNMKKFGAITIVFMLFFGLLASVTVPTYAQTTITKSITDINDDAEEEGPDGTDPNKMYLNSSDIELVNDIQPPTYGSQKIGLRFTAMTIPAGATIMEAFLTFRAIDADEPNSNSSVTNLTIKGQLIGNAPTFTTTSSNISSRTLTTASASWAPASWTTNSNYNSPSIVSVIQEIVNQATWASGNAIAIIITGSGHRASPSYDGDRTNAAKLVVTYTTIPTPVELVSFNAKVKNNVVLLDWKTATEVNNYGFEIERSQTSNVKCQNWEKIGFVNGHGNSNSPKEYSFEDSKLLHPAYQYRLRQVDNNGSYEYSNIVSVLIGQTPNSFTLSQNYPNPFNPSTKISWQSPVSGWQTLKVYNILGNEVATLVNEFREAGYYEVEFSANGGSASGRNASQLTSGVYIYKISAGNFSDTKKMILSK